MELVMTRKELNEIKSQYTLEDCGILRLCGCYVDGERNKITQFNENFLNLPEEEKHKYFDIYRKDKKHPPKPCRPDFLNEQGVVHQQADGIYFAGQYRRLSFSSRKTKRTNLRAVNASACLCWHLFTSLYLRW